MNTNLIIESTPPLVEDEPLSPLEGPRYVEHPDRVRTFIVYNLLNVFMGTFVSAFTPLTKVLGMVV